MNNRTKTLSEYVSNRVSHDKHQLANTTSTIRDYVDRIDDCLAKIRDDDYNIDNLKTIVELALRLRILYELRISYESSLSSDAHIQKEVVEVLENDAK